MSEPNNLPARLQPLEPHLYTANDVADRLRCSVRHVWRLHDAGDMPAAVRVGRLVRWPRKFIDDWVAAGCPKRRR